MGQMFVLEIWRANGGVPLGGGTIEEVMVGVKYGLTLPEILGMLPELLRFHQKCYAKIRES